MVSHATANLAGAVILMEDDSSADRRWPSNGFPGTTMGNCPARRHSVCRVAPSAAKLISPADWPERVRAALQTGGGQAARLRLCSLLAGELDDAVQMGPYPVERL